MNPPSPALIIAASMACSLVPLVIGIATSYLKVSIVLGLVRNALGTQNVPGPLVISALSLSITALIMTPVFEEVRMAAAREAIKPADFVPFSPGFEKVAAAASPVRSFLEKHSGENERKFFEDLRRSIDGGNGSASSSIPTLIPAFMVTELKGAFRMGCALLLPFLVVDLVIANVLAGLGMYMMSPTTVALPIKLALFVSSDAWMLIVRALIASYET